MYAASNNRKLTATEGQMSAPQVLYQRPRKSRRTWLHNRKKPSSFFSFFLFFSRLSFCGVEKKHRSAHSHLWTQIQHNIGSQIVRPLNFFDLQRLLAALVTDNSCSCLLLPRKNGHLACGDSSAGDGISRGRGCCLSLVLWIHGPKLPLVAWRSPKMANDLEDVEAAHFSSTSQLFPHAGRI